MQQQSDIYHFATCHNNDGIRYMERKENDKANRCFRIALQYVRSFVESDGRDVRINDDDMKASIQSSRIRGTDDLLPYADVMSSDAMVIPTDSTTHGNNFDLDMNNHAFRPILIELPNVDPDSLSPVCHGNNSMEMERMLSIILYNMGICYIHSMRVRRIDGTNNNSELLPSKALKVLLLSHRLTQTMISKFQSSNASTVTNWYRIHQLEFRMLSALRFLYQNNVNDRLVVIRIEERMRRIQQVLRFHETMVHFLRSLSSTTTAPCA